MWIKWKYNDHGWPDFQEREIPNDLDGFDSVEDFLIEYESLPVWSERYDIGRIEWHEIKLSNQKIQRRRIVKMESAIKYYTIELEKAKAELKALTSS